MPSSRRKILLKTEDILIGALLRFPAVAIHRRIIAKLNAAGFDDLRLPHIPVFLYPGPEGEPPSVLAERAAMSKQAMNQLLRSLGELGYLVRNADSADSRARAVRLTRRGHAAYSMIYTILLEIEREWAEELGPNQFTQLKKLLVRVWESPLVS